MLIRIECPLCHGIVKVNQGDDATSLQTICEHLYRTPAIAYPEDNLREEVLVDNLREEVWVEVRCPGSKARIAP